MSSVILAMFLFFDDKKLTTYSKKDFSVQGKALTMDERNPKSKLYPLTLYRKPSGFIRVAHVSQVCPAPAGVQILPLQFSKAFRTESPPCNYTKPFPVGRTCPSTQSPGGESLHSSTSKSFPVERRRFAWGDHWCPLALCNACPLLQKAWLHWYWSVPCEIWSCGNQIYEEMPPRPQNSTTVLLWVMYWGENSYVWP